MMATSHSRFHAIMNELRNRKVFKVAIVYVLMAWGVMQVGELMFEALQVPEGAYTLLVILVLLGFPVAVVLAWAYEITPEGVRRDLVRELQAETVSAGRADPGKRRTRSGCKRLAIMPFRDMSRKRELGYFCEGLAEEIQGALCGIDRLEVVARAHAVPFGGKKIDIEQVAGKLGVDMALEGSVRESGGRLRIAVQLVSAKKGTDIWSKAFDVDGEDEFLVQQRTAESITDCVRRTMRSGQYLHGVQCDPLTFDYYRRGLRFFRRRSARDAVFAQIMFTKATESDNAFSAAWAGLACACGYEYLHFNKDEAVRDKLEHCADMATSRAQTQAESWVARGVAALVEQRHHDASVAFETAVGINPGLFEAHWFNALNRERAGDPVEAAKQYARALVLREKDYLCSYGQALMLREAGDEENYERALDRTLKIVEARLDYRPDDFIARSIAAMALLSKGETRKAEESMAETLAQARGDAVLEYRAACFYSQAGKPETSIEHLLACSRIGRLDTEWLARDPRLSVVRRNPRFESVTKISAHPEHPLSRAGLAHGGSESARH
jgi:TolB-like protein/tetratricopeptide (TPR) repeat protein